MFGRLAAIVCCCFAAGSVAGQSTQTTLTDADRLAADVRALAQPIDEEVIVRGQRSIWRQLERAEDAFFERFNAINSHDDFDITCQLHARLGTKIKTRRCEPKFWSDENANIARDTLYTFQGSSAGSPGVYWSMQHRNSELMLDEITALAQQDQQLAAALENLAGLRRRLAAAPSESAVREVVPPDGVPLPYDADLIVFGRVGPQDWTYLPTNRTFTLAEVDGDIFEIEARCDGELWRCLTKWTSSGRCRQAGAAASCAWRRHAARISICSSSSNGNEFLSPSTGQSFVSASSSSLARTRAGRFAIRAK
jgi:hypothetical protein